MTTSLTLCPTCGDPTQDETCRPCAALAVDALTAYASDLQHQARTAKERRFRDAAFAMRAVVASVAPNRGSGTYRLHKPVPNDDNLMPALGICGARLLGGALPGERTRHCAYCRRLAVRK